MKFPQPLNPYRISVSPLDADSGGVDVGSNVEEVFFRVIELEGIGKEIPVEFKTTDSTGMLVGRIVPETASVGGFDMVVGLVKE